MEKLEEIALKHRKLSKTIDSTKKIAVIISKYGGVGFTAGLLGIELREAHYLIGLNAAMGSVYEFFNDAHHHTELEKKIFADPDFKQKFEEVNNIENETNKKYHQILADKYDTHMADWGKNTVISCAMNGLGYIVGSKLR